MKPYLLLSLLPLMAACATGRSATPEATPAPRVDYHQHLVSAAFSPIVKLPARDGKALLAELDAAGIDKAVVLSVGYSFSDERKKLDDPDRLTREEAVAPSIEIVVAHFGGSGPGYPSYADEVIGVFAAAAERGDPRMRNVYFDMATVVTAETTPEEGALLAKRIRQVGAQRVLYGSDLGAPGGSIRAGWEIFRGRTPLTAGELRTIAGNVTRFVQ